MRCITWHHTRGITVLFLELATLSLINLVSFDSWKGLCTSWMVWRLTHGNWTRSWRRELCGAIILWSIPGDEDLFALVLCEGCVRVVGGCCHISKILPQAITDEKGWEGIGGIEIQRIWGKHKKTPRHASILPGVYDWQYGYKFQEWKLDEMKISDTLDMWHGRHGSFKSLSCVQESRTESDGY